MNDNKMIGWEVKKVAVMIMRYVNEMVVLGKEEGITGLQALIICFVKFHEGKDIFQRDLEKELKVRRATISGILTLMEKKDLVRRESVPQDARLRKIVLTPKSIELEGRIQERIQMMEEKLSAGITKREMETFFKVLSKIKNNMSEE